MAFGWALTIQGPCTKSVRPPSSAILHDDKNKEELESLLPPFYIFHVGSGLQKIRGFTLLIILARKRYKKSSYWTFHLAWKGWRSCWNFYFYPSCYLFRIEQTQFISLVEHTCKRPDVVRAHTLYSGNGMHHCLHRDTDEPSIMSAVYPNWCSHPMTTCLGMDRWCWVWKALSNRLVVKS